MLRRRWPIALFAAWSGYVWVTRIVNAWSDTSTEASSAKVISTVSAGVLLVGAAATVAILVRARARAFIAAEVSVLRVFVVATIALWGVRVPQILLDGDHGAAFKVVHTVLAVVSLALAALTWRRATVAPFPTAAGSTPVSPAANAGR